MCVGCEWLELQLKGDKNKQEKKIETSHVYTVSAVDQNGDFLAVRIIRRWWVTDELVHDVLAYTITDE